MTADKVGIPVADVTSSEVNNQEIDASLNVRETPKKGETDVKEGLENIRQTVQLNPQPEPPSPVIEEENLAIIKPLYLQESNKTIRTPIPLHVQMDTKTQISTQGDHVKLLEGDKNFTLSSTPEDFLHNLSFAMGKQGFSSGSVQQITLHIVEDKPVYDLHIKEKIRLLGIFPLVIKTQAIISAENNTVQNVNRPWYANISSIVNNIKNIKLIPDFALTAIELAPDSYAVGNTATAKVTLSNLGAAGAMTHFSISKSVGGTEWLVTINGGQAAKFLAGPVYLKPGESVVVNLGFDVFSCGPVKVEFDPGNFLEEEDFSNNSITATATCN
jgi:hypothetical protein